MRLVWEPRALDELSEAAERSQSRAGEVVRVMEMMAELGWSLGRRTLLDPRSRYVPVGRLGVVYRVRGDELRVIRVVDCRGLRELP